MANFTSLQLRELDKMLNYGGYTPLIANSNSEFSNFFARLGIDIYKDYDMGSKGKTLYNFWVTSTNDLALKVIKEIKNIVLYEYSNKPEKLVKAEYLFNSIESTLSNNLDISYNSLITNKKYEIIRELTPGGFGDTYLIKDTALDKIFVLKRYRGEFLKEEDNARFLSKFLEEIKILYDLNHPNIIRIFDYSSKNSAWYIMEYADGGNIEEYLKKKPQDINKLFTQAIDAFYFLESKHKCHRDIRINNVLVTADGILKIIDFGFGKIIENNGTIKDATKQIQYPYTLPKELNCEVPKYDKKTEVYFVGKLFYNIIKSNEIDGFTYNDILKEMIHDDPTDRIDSFLNVKNAIRDFDKQYQVIPQNLKQNYEN